MAFYSVHLSANTRLVMTPDRLSFKQVSMAVSRFVDGNHIVGMDKITMLTAFAEAPVNLLTAVADDYQEYC